MIAVKAPPETQLEVPDLSEVCMGSGNGVGAGLLPYCPNPGSHGCCCLALSSVGVSPWVLGLGGAVWGQGMDLVICVSPFQVGTFCGSVIV